jgi:valyl-tRNA synthetase
MYKNWPSGKAKKDQSQKDVYKIIDIISELRSFKNELNVSPGSFVDISINKINKKNKTLMTNNEVVLKKLGRINNFFEEDQQKPSATLVISGDIFKIYFDENVDLNLIKENLVKRQSKYQEEMDKISQRLSNKGFTDNAPKNIVEQEKTNYSNLKDDIKKISLTIESL